MTPDQLVALAISNVPLLGLALAFVLPLCLETRLSAARQLSWLLLLGLGVPLVWMAWWHLARPEQAAEMLGLARADVPPGPLQRGLGLAELAMGLVACLSPARPLPFKGAIVWTLAIALGGDAAARIAEAVARRDLVPAHAGLIVWEALAPLAALTLLFAAGVRRRAR